jgi:hypothetical protein
MRKGKELIIFCLGLVLAFVYWRLRVLFFYGDGKIPFLRNVTGLTIHHYHLSIVILTFSLLLYLFYSQRGFFVFFIGIGLGGILDSFMSRLFRSFNRVDEIFHYNVNFLNTLLLFLIVMILGLIFCLMKDIKSLWVNVNNGRRN